MDKHRAHVGLVWMCTKHGTSTDVHLVHVGLGYTPSTRGTGMDSKVHFRRCCMLFSAVCEAGVHLHTK